MLLDWSEVVSLDPKGYMDLNDGEKATYGPVERILVTPHDNVVIVLKWTAARELGPVGIPTGDWRYRAVSCTPTMVTFPNGIIPFELQMTPEKGKRVMFGMNIIYIDPVEKITPEDVVGFDFEVAANAPTLVISDDL